MKRSVVFLLVVSVVCIEGNSQIVTLSQRNALLQDVFKDIEKQTDYHFFVLRHLLKDAKRVTIDVKDTPLKDALDLTFRGQPVTYAFIEKTIIVKLKEPPPEVPTSFINITGKITDEKGEPVAGATVEIKGSTTRAVANEKGEFSFTGIHIAANIIITSVNYEPQEVTIQGRQQLLVQLNKKVGELTDVVVVATGYQRSTREKTTGSFFKLDRELLNRKVSTNIIDRLDGVTSGLIFNKNIVPGVNQPDLTIRGRSTIFANPNPLIVVDNFPYAGDVDNINPNDVESITVLKDAAATSIWGVLSGNGVIVITTKNGEYNQPVKVSFNSNITVGDKPDLFYEPKLSSSDYIEIEKYLFEKGFYSTNENRSDHPILSPVVEILIKQRDHQISNSDTEMLLNTLKGQDTRKEKEKYFYRKSINQQYAVNASGGGANYKYYISAGYDKNLGSLISDQSSRKTFSINNTISILKNKLELSANVGYTESNTKSLYKESLIFDYPYFKLVDAYGRALPVPKDLRQPYKDSAGNGKLLDWNFRPYDEIRLSDNERKVSDYRINIGIKYTILNGLTVNLLFQNNKGFIDQHNYQSQQTYYTRNLINQFTQIGTAGGIEHKVPLGGIVDHADGRYEANNTRIQFNYDHSWNSENTLEAIGGLEVRDFEMNFNSNRVYGYKINSPGGEKVDYEGSFPIYSNQFEMRKITFTDFKKGGVDRYISYYTNVIYTYKKRYIFSLSARKDESNLFGVKTNQKGVPLWSAGAGWIISNEKFYRQGWLPYLKFRVTNGYNGNVDKSVSAFTTAKIDNPNIYSAIYSTIINPPNPSLRWERVHILNVGIDFASKKRRIEGSIEYYIRNSKDLIGNSPLDPTTGNTQFRGNTANIEGKGIDISINTKNIDKKLSWNTTILFSHTTDRITSYKVKETTIISYFKSDILNPMEGRPLYSIYSLRWLGLDPAKGDPQGLLNKEPSKDYAGILNSSNFDDLIYNGPANPTFFGSIRNTISCKQVELSFNISWKAGYYFRRSSINYYNLFNGSPGHPDYTKRWQQPGDENVTNIPSIPYPANSDRDDFYKNSEILIEKGDHVRLQDIRLSYSITKEQISRLPMQLIQFYVYANNLGIIWRANNKSIDPDYVTGIPDPRTLSAGIRVDF